MNSRKYSALAHVARFCRGALPAMGSVVMLFVVAPAAHSVSWDSQALTMNDNPAGSATQWWFDHFNWGGTGNTPGAAVAGFLPSASSNSGGGPSAAEINAGTTTLPGGEGVVYYPFYDSETEVGDPNFPVAGSYLYPSGYNAQTFSDVYISRNTTNHNLLTIKGNMSFLTNNTAMIVGRSGSTALNQNLGTVVQTAGTVLIDAGGTNLDIGQREASGWGNGVYDYRGGILRVGANFTGVGIRLSHGSASNGTGGHGRFIMHNPTTDGYVRTYNFATASDGNSGDGVLTGVGINEFHFENGSTRPIQVENNLSINNGPVATGSAIKRSARLELVLHEAPTVDENGVPQTIGLFDTRFGQVSTSGILGTGDLDGDTNPNNDRVFSSADGTRHFYPSSRWAAVKTAPSFADLDLQDEDFLLTAVFGDTLYRWEVSYTGNITWEGEIGVDYGNSSVVASVAGTGGGDVVLIGHSSMTLDLGLTGDYNADGTVDAADYVLWRHGGPLENQGDDPLVVNEADYGVWMAQFGATEGGGANSSNEVVPEPTALLLALFAMAGAGLVRRMR